MTLSPVRCDQNDPLAIRNAQQRDPSRLAAFGPGCRQADDRQASQEIGGRISAVRGQDQITVKVMDRMRKEPGNRSQGNYFSYNLMMLPQGALIHLRYYPLLCVIIPERTPIELVEMTVRFVNYKSQTPNH